MNWGSVEDAEPAGSFWCHGATGIAHFFLHAAALDALPEAPGVVARAARTVARGARGARPTQCHGLAGNIELLLDCYLATGEHAYLAEARSLVQLLLAFATERDGRLLWAADEPDIFSPDYMVGYAGIAMRLLRLAEPESRPHQLSLAGFQYLSGRAEVAGKVLGRTLR